MGKSTQHRGTLREFLMELVDESREQLKNDFTQITPIERLTMVEKFLPYLLPKGVDAGDVEGAVYTKEDIVEGGADFANWGGNSLQKWYEK